MDLKYQLQRELKNLIHLMDCILYQIFNIIFKTHGRKTDNPSLRMHTNTIGNRVTSKI